MKCLSSHRLKSANRQIQFKDGITAQSIKYSLVYVMWVTKVSFVSRRKAAANRGTNMAILDTVKKALLIPLTETYADEELLSHIEACKEIIRYVGVADDVVNGEGVPIVDSLILIYCKTFFGFKNDGSVKELPKSFEMLIKQLSFTKGSTS